MQDKIYKFKLIPTYQLFYNEDSCFGVFNFKTANELPELKSNKQSLEFDNMFGAQSDDEILYFGVLSGKMQKLMLNIEYDCEARLAFNKKYNKYQYEPIRISTPQPTTISQQRDFLLAIITERQTDILLEAYPNIVQDIIDNKEIDLKKTKGIKEYTFNNIRDKVMENYVLADILTLLSPLGVTPKKIKKLTDNEPNTILLKEKLLKNPYILTEIDGLGFKSVDNLALKLNPSIEISIERTCAFVEYYLDDIANSIGHTWITLRDLRNATINTIPKCIEVYDKLIEDYKEDDRNNFLYITDNTIGLKRYYQIEKKIFKKIIELNKAYPIINDIDVEKAIKVTEKKLGFSLTEEQRNAVRSIQNNNMIVVTASAGSGKTTCINAIIEAFRGVAQIAMCALSAKAAQRMKEVTGVPASTIHRLLGFKNGEFEYNEDKTMPYQLLIVDEASMINSSIFLSLLSAVQKGCKVVIVFDFAQLPPIGAGNIATDLLYGNLVKINKFTKVHRQGEKSGILMDANKIRKQINPLNKPESVVIHGELKDMIYKFRENRNTLNELAIKAYMLALKDTDVDDLVVITPRKKDCVNSSREINIKIQDLVLPDEHKYIKSKKGDKIFKLGAKVIQKKNDYERGVFNGEIGYIKEIYDDIYIVDFKDGKEIEFDVSDMENMELAYSLTLHSCQGSQWHTVICIIDFNSYTLLDKCLLYTGITRAEKRCMVIAEPKAFKYSVETDKSIVRQTYLKNMIENYKIIA